MSTPITALSSEDESLLDAALAASLDGGAAILEVYESDDFNVEIKGDGSPLTRADRAAHEAIMVHLEATGLPVLSEEGKGIEHAERSRWERFWLVDPLDGTKEFIKRNGEFTVNVALIERGVPVYGVVFAPVTQALYVGAGAFGAYVVKNVTPTSELRKLEAVLAEGETLPLAPSDRPYRVVGSRSHMSEETASYVETLRADHPDLEMISCGSSLKLCMVAEGAADVYPRFAPTMEWDTGAADAVARGAGKRVLQWEPGKGPAGVVEYNKENLLNPWFLVAD